MSFRLISRAFEEGAVIPPAYTCDGRDVSPPLEWTRPPAGTKSFAVICDDPDAPGRPFTHWLAYDIPPHALGLPEGFTDSSEAPDGTRQGTNDFGRIGYGGPCPPPGTHRYYFKLYALDRVLDLPPGGKRYAMEKLMAGHILAETSLMGKYKRDRG